MSRTRISRRTTLVLALIGAVLIGIIAFLIAGWTSPAQQGSPQALTPTRSTSASAQPGAEVSTQQLTGGDLGKRIPFQSGDATGWLSITAAQWADTGVTAPPTGQRYLVVTMTVECSRGSLVVDGQWLRAKTESDWTGPGYGPELANPLTHHLLSPGDQVSGQVGFALASGAATIGLLDENLTSVAELSLTAP